MQLDVDTLTTSERKTLEDALDVLLPPEGSFPVPSECDVIDGFILPRLVHRGEGEVPYPGIDVSGLRRIIAALDASSDMEEALKDLEQTSPRDFAALWALAVYGYYSRSEVTAAIQRDLACGYHGAPLPLGYAHIIQPWDRSDPLQYPANPRGRYIRTEDVRRIELPGGEGDSR